MKKDQNGLSLLENIFIFSVTVIIIGNFFLLHKVSTANNTATGNLDAATKLAQSSVKEIVNISEKKIDKAIVINGNSYNWKEIFTNNISFLSCNNPHNPESICSDFVMAPCSSEIYSNKSLCIIQNTQPFDANSWKITQDIPHFSRKIRIANEGTGAKKVTVLVWWTDSLGLHKSAISRVLQK